MKDLRKEIVYVLLYKILFDYTMYEVILPWSSILWREQQFVFEIYILTFVATIFLSFVTLKYRGQGFIGYSIYFVVYLYLIPSVSYFGLSNMPIKFLPITFGYWIFLILALLLNHKLTSDSNLEKRAWRISDNMRYYFLFFSVTILTVLFSGLYGDFRLFVSFDIANIFRYEFREINLPFGINYLIPLIATILIPYTIIYTHLRKNYVLLIPLLIYSSMLYSIAGNKSWLYVNVMTLFIVLFADKILSRVKLQTIIFLAISFFLLINLITFKYLNSYDLIRTFDRVFSIPSQISYYYFDFFGQNEYLFLRESIFRFIASSPYQINSPFLIGGTYLSGFGEHANNGLMGDAYSNFGLLGIIVYPFVIVLIMRTLGSLISHDKKTSIIFSFILIWNLINGPLFAWLLSGGVLFLVLISKFLPLNNSTSGELTNDPKSKEKIHTG